MVTKLETIRREANAIRKSIEQIEFEIRLCESQRNNVPEHQKESHEEIIKAMKRTKQAYIEDYQSKIQKLMNYSQLRIF
jgi:proline dehydrogenase